jgi:hypothetical protein
MQVPADDAASELVNAALEETTAAASALSGTLSVVHHDGVSRDALARASPSHVQSDLEDLEDLEMLEQPQADFTAPVRRAT